MAKKKKKRGKGGVIALLLAAIVGAGYFLRDCLPGFGTGGGSGSGTASSDEESESETTDSDNQTEGEKGTVSVVVKGEECTVDGGDAAPCTQACEDIKSGTEAASRIDVDATVGAHAVVEDLKKCLDEGGFKDVTVRSE